ncbi:MAG: preprotein translocase subunit SecG [Spirochaetes bacterium]|nr:preprotein translocase subunit SecG [Spirochaetota bacterium]MBN2770291.1 preprotein translocase subunit SecG [Spirochaetota bacterium]
MGILTTILTVVFVIVCVLAILLILLQSDKSSGMGIIGGSSQSTFGSSTADVVTKITGFLVALFLVIALTLGGLYTYSKSASRKALEESSVSSSESSTAGTDGSERE